MNSFQVYSKSTHSFRPSLQYIKLQNIILKGLMSGVWLALFSYDVTQSLYLIDRDSLLNVGWFPFVMKRHHLDRRVKDDTERCRYKWTYLDPFGYHPCPTYILVVITRSVGSSIQVRPPFYPVPLSSVTVPLDHFPYKSPVYRPTLVSPLKDSRS